MISKNGKDIPLGLSVALMKNTDALLYFSGLDAKQQDRIIDGAKGMKSRDEMRSYVDGLTATD